MVVGGYSGKGRQKVDVAIVVDLLLEGKIMKEQVLLVLDMPTDIILGKI